MENFVHFTGKLHHRGMKFVRAFTCTGYEHSKVDRLVCYITDNFRMSAVQNETLNWETQITIDQCNCTCK